MIPKTIRFHAVLVLVLFFQFLFRFPLAMLWILYTSLFHITLNFANSTSGVRSPCNRLFDISQYKVQNLTTLHCWWSSLGCEWSIWYNVSSNWQLWSFKWSRRLFNAQYLRSGSSVWIGISGYGMDPWRGLNKGVQSNSGSRAPRIHG